MPASKNYLYMTPGQVYREGAYKGIYTGIYLCLIFLSGVLSAYFPLLSGVSLALIVGIPFFVYKIMAYVHRKYFCLADFSALWMLGISLFLSGSLICAVISYVYLQYLDPDYIATQVQAVQKAYSKSNTLKDSTISEYLDIMVKNRFYPSAIDVSIEMLWITTFFGSILSMVLALLVRGRYAKQNQPPKCF